MFLAPSALLGGIPWAGTVFLDLLPVNGSAVRTEMHPLQGQPGVQCQEQLRFKLSCAGVLLKTPWV